MDRSTPVNLIVISYTTDELLQPVPVETSRQVFANIQSIRRSEWTAAGQKGLTPSWVMTMFTPDYEGEEIVSFVPPFETEPQRFSVYRTYNAGNEELELYLQRETGTK